MRTAVHGMPRIGEGRSLKRALEGYWSGKVDAAGLQATAATIRKHNWEQLAAAGVDFLPSNDFSLYDHVLDAALMVGVSAARFGTSAGPDDLDRYFAMARGGDVAGRAVAPLDLTKWFDTNYHHLVPELAAAAAFSPHGGKAVGELAESAALGLATTPVLVGPLTLLLRSAVPDGFDLSSSLDALVATYGDLLAELAGAGAGWVHLDEPVLVEDRTDEELAAFTRAYRRLTEAPGRPRLCVSTYFGHVGSAMSALCDLPVEGVGLDLCRGPENFDLLAGVGGLGDRVLFAGVVDGRNVWANDLGASLDLLERLDGLAAETVASTSCSLLHVPLSLAAETTLDPEVRPWLAFAEEKLGELATLARGAGDGREAVAEALAANADALAARARSPRVHDASVRRRLHEAPADPRRTTPPEERARLQRERLGLPVLPTTTIGSFPQTGELRAARAAWRKGTSDDETYRASLRAEIDRVVALQEEIGLDLVVHGEPERDDMVRYFAAQLEGYVLPEEGWVQSYGSRCVRPPVLFGDVSRPAPMTVEWTSYARSRTARPVKGMLTGPVTMLRWSFVRDDQTDADTAAQLGLAIRDELVDLQAAGTAAIQVDEPALREGMPLRHADRAAYLAWATRAFRLASSAAEPATQVHTHMCYAQLGDVVGALDDLDVDVVSLEAARAKMELVDTLATAPYRGASGPGIYDVHDPHVPDGAELEGLLQRAVDALGADRLWVNPDCGLKTRGYEETTASLTRMVDAARKVRAGLGRNGKAPG